MLRDLGMTEPEDIDLELVAWHLGVTIKTVALTTCEACIVGNERHAVICVDETRSPERRRFSIGHELGHWHHHRGRHLICRADEIARGSGKQLEQEADAYAADLLIPPSMLKAGLRDYKKVDLRTLRELRGRFQTSLTSIAIAIARSDRFPMAVVCSRPDGRHWAARAPSLSRWWRLRTDVDRESLAGRMLADPNEPESRYASRIGADAWFTTEGADRYEVVEQSYRSSDDEVVTIIGILDERMMS
ncbi:ImmA/IrrE family metallo-endopeptidase [Antarcticirhabdus aurantiaca]|uniref:ImmA/IrrE family metallo-endopeptidase n=1 Tax=Antarcticirhabdus aurantiaca TaxID=2606717 RepID=A0ACD4NWX4_9HYPH|nr:ImmA/IrrE family metallo-endopeptidase [Antarcticirhabdus aurantiaca]WAJ31228.1 ImmA/IrrE family metallo-endopeptidase [Jeongeuplla avenae]